MSSKHTPGPWERDSAQVVSRGDVWVAEIIQRGRPTADDDPNAIEANARLIAAAPDLLEAAKATMEYWDGTGFSDCEEGCECIVDFMRAAIAKAEQR